MYIRHCRTVPKPYGKTVERGKIDTPDTHIHNRSLSLLGTSTSIKSVYFLICLHGIYLPGSNKCFLANQFKSFLLCGFIKQYYTFFNLKFVEKIIER